ncbi:MFS transporter [Luedemannella flava]
MIVNSCAGAAWARRRWAHDLTGHGSTWPRLLLAGGGPRYAAALLIDAVGGGLMRPFVLLYGVVVLDVGVAAAGLALSAGLFAGLAALPVLGRWLDRGARSSAVAATLLVRAAGVAALLAGAGHLSFVVGAVLLGVGGQAWPAAHAALVTAVAPERVRDAALAAGRALRNAGLGVGALVATVAVGSGGGALIATMAVTGVVMLASALLTATMRLTAPAPTGPARVESQGPLRGLTAVFVANVPLAFCF